LIRGRQGVRASWQARQRIASIRGAHGVGRALVAGAAHRVGRALVSGVALGAFFAFFALVAGGAGGARAANAAPGADVAVTSPAWPWIADVRVSVASGGERVLDTDRLLAAWRPLIGGPAEPSRLAAAVDRVLAQLADAGRLDAVCRLRLAPTAPDSARLEVAIDEGRGVPLGAVAIEGTAAIAESDARRILGLSAGVPFDPDRFVAGAGELLERYEARGFPFARVAPRDFHADSALAFRVLVDEGREGRVVGLALSGNADTRESFVAREMLLRRGRAWNRRALERGRERLLRTGLFRTVGEPYPLVDETGGGLRVGLTVEEALANRIEGVFGWNRGEGNEDGFFSGYFDLLFRNLGGVGRRAAVRWERRGRDAREIRIGFREPWLPFVPIGAGFDLRRTFRDSTYVRTEVEGAIDVPLSGTLTLSARAAADSWSPGDRTPATVPKSRRNRGGVGFRYEGTDFPPNPSRGLNVSLEGEYGEKAVDVEAAPADSAANGAGVGAAASGANTIRFREEIARAAVEVFVPLGGPHLVAFRARGDLVSSDEEPIPDYELFFLGGARSLRGYDEDRFLGERVAVATLEYRFRLAGRSRVFLFVDQGFTVLRRESATAPGLETLRGSPLGWGGGLQADSRLGVVGIGVGIPEGEGLAAARVHVSIEQEF